MKTNWVKLKDVCDTTSGGTPSRDIADYYGGDIPWVKSGELLDGWITDTEEKITKAGLANSSAKIFSAGTLLIALYGATVGRLGILGLDATTNQAVCGITPNENLDRDFLFYFLLKQREKLIGSRTGGAQPNISQEIIREIEIPLPPLDEQKRIASLLARADRLRGLRRAARALGESLLQGVFLEMFGDVASNSKNWDMCIIDDVVEFSQYGTSEKSNSEKRGYPVLGMANITYEGRIDLEKLSYVELSDKEFADLKLEYGDIIFNRTNSTELVGKTTFWNHDFDAVIASYLVKLKLKKDVLPEYFVALLNTSHFKRLFQERCKKAVGQSNISPTLLKEFPMIVPPLPLQEEFARVVARVEGLRGRMSESERQVEGLFGSLLAESFGG